MTSRALRRPTRLRDRLLPFAIGLLLLAQTLALVHRVVHAPSRSGDAAHRSVAALALSDGHAGTSPFAVAIREAAPTARHALFADHGSAECRLFDQLALPELATAPAHATACALPRHTAPVASEAAALAARLRASRARDPPHRSA